MGHYEDAFYEIHNDISKKGLREEFESQIQKMLNQEKHKHKSTKEMWEYAHHKVTSSLALKNNLDY